MCSTFEQRIDATIAALKSAGVPVIWVGLASQRGTKSSQDYVLPQPPLIAAGLDKAGIVIDVDLWDRLRRRGRAATRRKVRTTKARSCRLRTGDGVYFTKFGARKLAHYVEREVQRGDGCLRSRLM